jgi:hypothetical protein
VYSAEGDVLYAQHHNGNVNGMSTTTGVMVGHAGLGSAVTVTCNQDSSPVPFAIWLEIMDVLYPRTSGLGHQWSQVMAQKHTNHNQAKQAFKAQVQQKMKLSSTSSSSSSLLSASLEPFQLVGSYSHPAYGPVDFKIDNTGTFVGAFAVGGYYPMTNYLTNTWFLNWNYTAEMPIPFTFVTNEDNIVTAGILFSYVD